MKKKEKKLEFNIGAVIKKPGSSAANKTGNWRTLKPVRDKKKCRKCGVCWMYCPDMAIDEKFKIDYDYCKGCGLCAKECIFGAIIMVPEEK